MKRPVSIIASLVASVLLASACSAAAKGKTEFTEICMKRMGNSTEKCGCYVGAVEAALTPEQFSMLATKAYENRQYSGADWLPSSVRSDPAISDALHNASTTCMQSV